MVIILLKEHFRECLICIYTNVSLFEQCTDSDGCAVDRAKAWCEMIDTIYYRSVYKKVLSASVLVYSLSQLQFILHSNTNPQDFQHIWFVISVCLVSIYFYAQCYY